MNEQNSDQTPGEDTDTESLGRVHPDYRPPQPHLFRLDDVDRFRIPDDDALTHAELSRIAAAVKEYRLRQARESFPAFLEYVFRDEDSDPGAPVPVTVQWYQEQWSHAMDTIDRLVIIAPRGHAKSTTAVARVLFELGRSPDLRIKVVGPSDGRAMERLFEIKQHIEHNPRLREVFPHLRRPPGQDTEFSKHKIIIPRKAMHRDASVEALGITATVTGGRADLILADDVVDRRNAIQMPAMREAIKQAWHSDWMQLLAPNARVWYLATPWHRCLVDGEMVETTRGLVRAEGLLSTDEVRQPGAEWSIPEAITRRRYSGPVVRVRVTGSVVPQTVTPWHRFPTERGLVEARDLIAGDRVYLDIRTPPEMGIDDVSEMEPAPRPRRKHPGSKIVRNRKSRISPEDLQARIDNGETYASIAEDLGYKTGKRMIHYLVKRYGLRAGDCLNRARPGYMQTEEFWALVGYWIAEGSVDTSTSATRLTFGYYGEELDYVDDAVACVQSALGVPVSVNRTGHATVVQFSEQAVADWFLGEFGAKGRILKLPPWFERLPQAFLDAALRAYLRGDGACRKASTQRYGMRLSTSSYQLACGWRRILAARYGATPRIYMQPRTEEARGDRWEVRCESTVAQYLGEVDSVSVPEMERSPQIHNDGERLWMRVREVRAEQYDGQITSIATPSGFYDTSILTSHNSDLTHHLIDNPEYHVLKRTVGDGFASIWPARFPESVLRRRYADSAIEYARAYLCQARDESEAPVRPEWFRFVRADQVDLEGLTILCSYDTAVGLRQTNDYTAGVVIGVRGSGEIYVLDAWHARLTLEDQAARIFADYQRFHPERILIEKVGQMVLDQHILSKWPALAGIVQTTTPKVGKFERLVGVTPLMQNGQVHFLSHLNPDDREAYRPGRGNIIGELTDFPIAAHDDLVDALSQGLHWARRWILDPWAPPQQAARDEEFGALDDYFG